MERPGRHPRRDARREQAAARASVLLLVLVWLVAVLDRGRVAELAGMHGSRGGDPRGQQAATQSATQQRPARRPSALAPLTVDPWRDPPWRLQLIPGIGRQRARRLVAARLAAGGLAWRSLEDLAWHNEVDSGTLRALLAGCAAQLKPGHTQPVRLTLGAGALQVR